MKNNKTFWSLNETKTGVLMVAAVFVVFFLNFSFLHAISLKMGDLNFKMRGPVEGKRNVVVVAIDQRSQDKFGRWPWTRTVLAELISKMSKFNPKVIGTDIVFSYPEERPDHDLSKQLMTFAPKSGPLREAIETAERRSDADGILAGTIKNARNVVPGYFFLTQEEDVAQLKMDTDADYKIIKHSRFPAVKLPAEGGRREFEVKKAAGVKPNIKPITDAAPYTGYFNMFPDDDGMMRGITNVVEFKEKFFPSLSLQLLRNWYGDDRMKLEFDEVGVKGIQIGDGFVATDEHGVTHLNYYGGEKAFPTVSAADLADGGLPDEKLDELLRGKIVLVGATAIGIYDMRSTPFGIVPGVFLHATFIQNVIDGVVLKRAGWYVMFDMISIILLGVVLTVAMKRLGAVGGAVLAITLILAYVWFQRYMFVRHNTLLDVFYPLLAITMVYGGIAFFKYIVESSEKKYVKRAFEYYLSPKVINRIMDDPTKLKLGGDMKQLTACFSDVKNFSGISEKLTPAELVELLNDYLSEMTNIILERDGTLDKYIGDAIVSFFGAPLEYEDHAWRACAVTMLCHKRLVELREKWGAEGKPKLEARFGINSGNMLVGNMGSSQRFDYTIMGDEVNLASRLEGINKQYGTWICVSESTWLEVEKISGSIDNARSSANPTAEERRARPGERREAGFEWRELDVIRVVGRKAPVKIFELLDFKGSLSQESKAWLVAYNKAYALYSERKFELAMNAFNKAALMNPNDVASVKMTARCQEFLNSPPPKDWDGVFTHTSK